VEEREVEKGRKGRKGRRKHNAEDTKVVQRGHRRKQGFDKFARGEAEQFRYFITTLLLYFAFYRVRGSPKLVRGRLRLFLAASPS
jgi:hypothetical protein